MAFKVLYIIAFVKNQLLGFFVIGKANGTELKNG